MTDRNLEDYKRRIAEMGAHAQQGMQEQIRRGQEQRAHLPRWLDDEIDLEESDPNKAIIKQWDDGYGNILYLNPDVPINQVHAVSSRITVQQKSFEALGSDEQAQIRTVFQPAIPTASTTPYQDFLKSETLGRRFQELKQSRPTPK